VAEHDLRVTVHLSPRGVPGGYFAPDVDAVRRALDGCVEDLRAWGEMLRTPIVTTCVGPYHRFQSEPPLAAQLDRLADVLAPVAAACHEMHRPLGIENHGDYYCDDLAGLCDRVEHLGIFLDTGNPYLIGEAPLPACRRAAPYTIGTHFKDHLVHPDPKTLTFVIGGSPLGEGHVGLREVYDLLRAEAPSPDRLVMQWEMVPPEDMDPFECLERSWAFVRGLPGADS
jgi:sugar phosphate isomerase/epimerase